MRGGGVRRVRRRPRSSSSGSWPPALVRVSMRQAESRSPSLSPSQPETLAEIKFNFKPCKRLHGVLAKDATAGRIQVGVALAEAMAVTAEVTVAVTGW